MAEENINQSLEPRSEPLQAELYNADREPDKQKPGFFTLLIGIFFTVRGVVRFYRGEEFEVWGVVTFIIGLVSLYMFFKDRL
ncbi:MAG TPA: hypothetical protein VGB44_06550 [Flavobacterium sp.]|jgi:hypothetical protein